jgi:nucleotide-binding universal stress UspA family protein
MASSPSPFSTPLGGSAANSPRTISTTLPDRSVPAFQLDGSKPSFIPAWRRPTLNTAGGDEAGRRPSVQFVPNSSKDKVGSSRSSSARPATSIRSSVASTRRLSSPPPPAQFRPSVSFDTFKNKQASEFSLTLGRKHRDYEYTKRSRTFLVGTDANEYSDTALEWLVDELVDDGDEIVCLRVVEKDSHEARKWSGGQGEKGYRKEAARFMESIEKKNTEDRAISLVLEFAIGKVQDAIQNMIKLYEPAMLIVGTKGRSLTGYQGLLSSGSVSKYCLQYSPVPVIVVRPSSKRESKKRKRLQDPTRRSYRDILDKSEDAPRGRGGHLLDERNRMSIMGSDLGVLGRLEGDNDPDAEARRVAEAIGWRAHRGSGSSAQGSNLSRVVSTASAPSEDSDDDMTMTEESILKSPTMGALDSPYVSDDEDEDHDYDAPRQGENMRPEDEAALLAYERAMKVVEEEHEEEEARAKKEERTRNRSAGGVKRAGRSTSRGRGNDDDENRGSDVLGLLAQLDRGIVR